MLNPQCLLCLVSYYFWSCLYYKTHSFQILIWHLLFRSKSHSHYVWNVWEKRLWHLLPHGQWREGPRHFLWLWELYYTIWHQAEAVGAHHHKQAGLMSPREDSTSKSGYFSFIQRRKKNGYFTVRLTVSVYPPNIPQHPPPPPSPPLTVSFLWNLFWCVFFTLD